MLSSKRLKIRKRLWHLQGEHRLHCKINNELQHFAACEGNLWKSSTRNEVEYWLKKDDLSKQVTSGIAVSALGFIELLRNQPLLITKAGRELMEGRELEDLFLRQLLKWQYPSPNHNSRDYVELFSIHPFLETLRLVRDLEGLSKVEIALFALPFTNYKHYSKVKRAIEKFRIEFSKQAAGVERESWVRSYYQQRVREIYQDDIASGRTSTREGGDGVAELIRKKVGNLNDYADSSMRYFLATGLFTFSSSGRIYRLSLLPERHAEVDQILQNTSRQPLAFDDAKNFVMSYLGNPHLPVLPSDNAPALRERLRVLSSQSPAQVIKLWGVEPSQAQAESNPIVLKSWARRLRELAEQYAANVQQLALQKPDAVDEITDMFEQIRQNKVPERPLFMEWNVWRAMSALDDGKIVNNFQMDRFGQPHKGAPGGVADIQCEYSDFHLSVEVTLSYGATQYKMEGEPVNRHVGLLQKAARDRNDARAVYGLFIADRLTPSVVAHFYGLHHFKTKEFGGAVSVIPLELNVFLLMLQSARNQLPIQSSYLRQFLNQAQSAALKSEDEEQWYATVKSLAVQWMEKPVP